MDESIKEPLLYTALCSLSKSNQNLSLKVFNQESMTFDVSKVSITMVSFIRDHLVLRNLGGCYGKEIRHQNGQSFNLLPFMLNLMNYPGVRRP